MCRICYRFAKCDVAGRFRLCLLCKRLVNLLGEVSIRVVRVLRSPAASSESYSARRGHKLTPSFRSICGQHNDRSMDVVGVISSVGVINRHFVKLVDLP